MVNFRPYDRSQQLLLPPDLREWVPEDDLAHFIIEAVERVPVGSVPRELARLWQSLADYEVKARNAVQAFWGNRRKAQQKQIEAGKADQGERGGVTAGKNMNGFLALVMDIVRANGLERARIHQERRVLTLPGYFRPTKLWDLLVMNEGRLIAALEFKSQVGLSFGNNVNNRAEEAIGTAHDFWTAYRESAFGEQPHPFVGWMMLLEDSPKSRAPVEVTSPHFPVFRDFVNGAK